MKKKLYHSINKVYFKNIFHIIKISLQNSWNKKRISYKFKLVLIFKTVFSEDRSTMKGCIFIPRIHLFWRILIEYRNTFLMSEWVLGHLVKNSLEDQYLELKFVVAGCGLVGR